MMKIVKSLAGLLVVSIALASVSAEAQNRERRERRERERPEAEITTVYNKKFTAENKKFSVTGSVNGRVYDENGKGGAADEFHLYVRVDEYNVVRAEKFYDRIRIAHSISGFVQDPNGKPDALGKRPGKRVYVGTDEKFPTALYFEAFRNKYTGKYNAITFMGQKATRLEVRKNQSGGDTVIFYHASVGEYGTTIYSLTLDSSARFDDSVEFFNDLLSAGYEEDFIADRPYKGPRSRQSEGKDDFRERMIQRLQKQKRSNATAGGFREERRFRTVFPDPENEGKRERRKTRKTGNKEWWREKK